MSQMYEEWVRELRSMDIHTDPNHLFGFYCFFNEISREVLDAAREKLASYDRRTISRIAESFWHVAFAPFEDKPFLTEMKKHFSPEKDVSSLTDDLDLDKVSLLINGHLFSQSYLTSVRSTIIRSDLQHLLASGDFPPHGKNVVEAVRYNKLIQPENRSIWKGLARQDLASAIKLTPSRFDEVVDLYNSVPQFREKKQLFYEAISRDLLDEWEEATRYRQSIGIELDEKQEEAFICLHKGIGNDYFSRIEQADLESVLSVYWLVGDRRICDHAFSEQYFEAGCQLAIEGETLRPWIEHIEETLVDKDLIGGSRYREVASK